MVYRRDRKAVVLCEGSGLGCMMDSGPCCCLGDLSGDAGWSCVTIEGSLWGACGQKGCAATSGMCAWASGTWDRGDS